MAHPTASVGEPEGAVRFVHSAALPEVEIMVGERSTHLWRVYHETYTACLVPGERNRPDFHVDWRYRGRNLTHPSNGVLLMEPGEVHVTRRLSAPASFQVLQIAPGIVEEAASDLGFQAPPHLALEFVRTPPPVTALRQLLRAVTEEASPLEQQSRLDTYVAHLLAHCSEESKPLPTYCHPGVRLAREYLHEHFSEAVTLADLERVAGLSRFHLIRSFKARYGPPPHAYQIQLRLVAARRLLRAGTPPAQAAAAAGFADQSHLGRHLKRLWGITPGRYAECVERARTF